jgi:ribosomal protein S4, bacterial/organelle type
MFNTTEKRERSLGTKLFLKGARCLGPKCASVRRPTRPGPHTKFRRKLSEYGKQLQEKQRIQWSYGLREGQLERIFAEALKNPAVTGDTVFRLLEQRLDNVVFRLGLTPSRSVARQLVGHGHLTVNGRKVTIPSYRVKMGDVIAPRKESREHSLFKELSNTLKTYEPPQWLHIDKEKYEGKVLSLPKDFDMEFDVNMVVDYYSK